MVNKKVKTWIDLGKDIIPRHKALNKDNEAVITSIVDGSSGTMFYAGYLTYQINGIKDTIGIEEFDGDKGISCIKEWIKSEGKESIDESQTVVKTKKLTFQNTNDLVKQVSKLGFDICGSFDSI